MGHHKGWNNADEFIMGRRFSNDGGYDDSFVGGFDGNRSDGDETFVSPTETVVNPTTNTRTVKKIHPTHVMDVNHNVTRVENYYPVTHSVKNIDSVEEYDCGSDIKNPHCKPVKRFNKKCHD
jgi:spore coat protein D